MKKTWLVVANASLAKIYRVLNATGALEPVAILYHPESRLHNRDLAASQQKDRNHRISSTPHDGETTSPKTQEAQKFAAEIAAQLALGRGQHAYERLILVAGPHFMGLLLAALDPATRKLVDKTLDKDLTHDDDRTLSTRLHDLIRYAA